MRQQKADRAGIETLRNHFIGKLIPGVGTWGELDVLRGWKDDFFGKAVDTINQYTAETVGAGSTGFVLDAWHGGNYGLFAGAGAGRYHRLWLGNAASGYDSLAAGSGWVMMARMTLEATTNILGYFGAETADGGGSHILAGINTSIFGNDHWVISTRTAGGALNNVDTGISADTNAHWHELDVYPVTGGLRQADYLLDGTRIGTTTVSVPTAWCTPYVMCYAIAAVSRYVALDFWAVIPRNLA